MGERDLPVDFEHILLAAFIFTPLQFLTPMRRGQKLLRRGLSSDICHLLFSGVLIKLGIGTILTVVLLCAMAAPIADFRDMAAAQPLWLQFVEALIVADLGYYAAHRLFHSVPALWRFHTIHHSIEEMDWIAAHRVHPVDQILTKSLSLAPLIAIGFSLDALVLFGVFFKWHSILKHSNVNVAFGPFRWLFVSPAFHHWHHANQREAINCNFAGQLSCLDTIFGTAYSPRGETPKRYGLDESTPSGYVDQLLHPFKTMPKRVVVSLSNPTNAAAGETVYQPLIRGHSAATTPASPTTLYP